MNVKVSHQHNRELIADLARFDSLPLAPWDVVDDKGFPFDIVSKDGFIVASVHGCTGCPINLLADVVAAVPDMVEELRQRRARDGAIRALMIACAELRGPALRDPAMIRAMWDRLAVAYSCGAAGGPDTPDEPNIVRELVAVLQECRRAESERRAKLLPGAPASTYTKARLARIDAVLAKAGAK